MAQAFLPLRSLAVVGCAALVASLSGCGAMSGTRSGSTSATNSGGTATMGAPARMRSWEPASSNLGQQSSHGTPQGETGTPHPDF